MRNKLMAGIWRYLVGVPPFLWEKQIKKAMGKVIRSTQFMTPEHRQVHHYVVKEMPYLAKPISSELVAENLGLNPNRALEILRELEKRLTFLSMNKDSEVVWAYPITVEKTPHAIKFNTGEELYAA